MFSTSEHCFSIQSAVCTIIIMMHATLYMLSALLFIASYNRSIHTFDHNDAYIKYIGNMPFIGHICSTD